MVITLVGETQAKVGASFFFMGPLAECRDCKRKTVCFNLEEGILYEIIGVRDKRHDCSVHEGGVRVVELKKIPIRTTIDSKHAIEGSMVSTEKSVCLNRGCDMFHSCFILGPGTSRKYMLSKVVGDVNCPDNRSLKLVVLEV